MKPVWGTRVVKTWQEVFTKDGVVLGDVGGTLEDALEGTGAGKALVVSAFVVQPEARGQGVGKALLQLVQETARREQAQQVLIVTDCPIERMFFIRVGYSARMEGVTGLATDKHYAVTMAL